jgi:hypothetical protein
MSRDCSSATLWFSAKDLPPNCVLGVRAKEQYLSIPVAGNPGRLPATGNPYCRAMAMRIASSGETR